MGQGAVLLSFEQDRTAARDSLPWASQRRPNCWRALMRKLTASLLIVLAFCARSGGGVRSPRSASDQVVAGGLDLSTTGPLEETRSLHLVPDDALALRVGHA